MVALRRNSGMVALRRNSGMVAWPGRGMVGRQIR
jgi:hypothetical protein